MDVSGEYYCEFCNEPTWNSLHMCEKKHKSEWIKATYVTMGWPQETICQCWKEIDTKPISIEK